MKSLNLNLVLELLDSSSESDVTANEMLLQRTFGLEKLVPFYVEAFYRIKNKPGRMYIAHYIISYVDLHPEIVDLAIYGLNDRSYIVRHHCCRILAFSGKHKALTYLEALKAHKNLKTREDAEAAINAITMKNHNLWVDRKNTGKVFWELERLRA